MSACSQKETLANYCGLQPKALKGIQPAVTSELGKIIIDLHPRRATVEVSMPLRFTINFFMQVGQCDFDDIFVVVVVAKHRATTAATETSRRMVRASVVHEIFFALRNLKAIFPDANPRHKAGTVSAPAHRAVAMSDEQGR